MFGSFNIPADNIASGRWLDTEHSLLAEVENGKADGISVFAAPAPCCCGWRSKFTQGEADSPLAVIVPVVSGHVLSVKGDEGASA